MLPACSFHSQSAVSHRSTWELIHTREYILETMILKRHLHSRTCEVYVSVSTNFPWLINNQRMILYTESSLVFFFFWICQGAMFTFFRLNNSIKNSTWSGTGRRRHLIRKYVGMNQPMAFYKPHHDAFLFLELLSLLT